MDLYTKTVIQSWLTLILTIAGIVLALFIVLRLAVYGRAFLKRFSLMRRLKKVCRTQGISCTVLSSPYRSLFRRTGTPELILQKDKKTFALQLFPCVFFKDTYLFDRDGKYHTISNFNPIYLNLRYYTIGINPDTMSDVLLPMTLQYRNETIRQTRRTRFAVPDLGDAAPLLCFNPIPCEIRKVTSNGREMVCDGDTICGYTVYSGTGLLKMLSGTES